jgi:hypothetical protein
MNNDVTTTESLRSNSPLGGNDFSNNLERRWRRRLWWALPITVVIAGAVWLVLTAFLARDNLEAAKQEAANLTSLVRDGRIAERTPPDHRSGLVPGQQGPGAR